MRAEERSYPWRSRSVSRTNIEMKRTCGIEWRGNWSTAVAGASTALASTGAALLLCGAIARGGDAPGNAAALTRGGGSSAAVIAPGPMWQHLAYLEGLTPKCVAVGNAGTLVFTDVEGYNTYSRTLSSSDHTPAVPVSQSSALYSQRACVVRAAEQTDVRVSLAYAQTSATSAVNALVRKSSFTSSAQDWTFAFPFNVSSSETAPLGLGVSRDGQTIVATAFNRLQNKQAIAVFQPGSGTPVYYTELLTYYQPMNCALSADGSTLYIVSQLYTLLFDTQHHTNAYFSSNLEYPYSGMAISGDGSAYAKSYASDHRVEVFHKSPNGSYALYATIPSNNLGQCATLAFSDDGNTLAGAYDTLPNVVTAVVFDVSSVPVHTVLQDTIGGDGPYWNTARDVSIAKDGSVFALGVTGSLSGSTPQLLAYARDAGTHAWSNVLAAHVAGSCVDVDVSADGTKVAAASLLGHADQPLGGSEVDLFRVEPQDLVLDGIPHAGASVTVRYSPTGAPTPGAAVALLQAPALATQPQTLPGAGTLFLDRFLTHSAGASHLDAGGNATFPLVLPGGSSAIGTTAYYQALCLSPRRLSQSWIKVTVVP